MYSWRVTKDLKLELEREARLRDVTVSSILDAAVRDYLDQSAADNSWPEVQEKLHASAAKTIGVMAGTDRQRSTKVRGLVRERLRQRYGR